MDKLSVVMDLSREIRVAFVCGLENDLGSIGELVSGQVDFAERSFSNETAESIVADRAEVFVGEFIEKFLV